MTQAAGGAGVRNVCESISCCLSATTALGAPTTVTVNLRDGASGAGTILQSWQLTLPAATLLPVVLKLSGLHIQGSPNTAMTFECASAVTNLMQAVSMSGYTNP